MPPFGGWSDTPTITLFGIIFLFEKIVVGQCGGWLSVGSSRSVNGGGAAIVVVFTLGCMVLL
jgi:hypothetical protein